MSAEETAQTLRSNAVFGYTGVAAIHERTAACAGCPARAAQRGARRPVTGDGSASAGLLLLVDPPDGYGMTAGRVLPEAEMRRLTQLLAFAFREAGMLYPALQEAISGYAQTKRQDAYLDALWHALRPHVYILPIAGCTPEINDKWDDIQRDQSACRKLRTAPLVYAVDPVFVVTVGPSAYAGWVGSASQQQDRQEDTVGEVVLRSPVTGRPLTYATVRLPSIASLISAQDSDQVKSKRGHNWNAIKLLAHVLTDLETWSRCAWGVRYTDRPRPE